MSNSSLHERFDEVLRAVGVRPIDVSRQLGTEPNKLYNIINGKTRPSVQTLESIVQLFPQINLNYLIGGIGPVLLSDTSVVESDMASSIGRIIPLPLLPASAYADYIKAFPTNSIPVMRQAYCPPVSDKQPGADWLILEVADEAMRPQINLGAFLLVSPIEISEWPYLAGGIYAVLFANQLLIRRLAENALVSQQKFTFVADSPLGAQLVIDGADIRALWEVEAILNSPVC